MKSFYENHKQLIACVAVIGVITVLFAIYSQLHIEHLIVLLWVFAMTVISMIICRKRKDVVLTLALLSVINLLLIAAIWLLMPTCFFATFVPLGMTTIVYSVIMSAVFDSEQSVNIMAVLCGCLLLYLVYFAYAGSTLIAKLTV